MKLALASGIYSVPIGHKKRVPKSLQARMLEVKNYSRFERGMIIAMGVIQYLAILSILLPILRLSTYSANVYTNGFTDILVTGVFDSNNGVNEEATSFFLKVCQLIFSIALPLMSTFALGMTTISLISSIIYLTKQDTFDLVHDLAMERRGNREGPMFNRIKSFYQQKGLREFLLSYCIDFKAYAFADAIAGGVEGAPTMQEFLRTIPKYIVIFGFCIIINNRALLDFIMKGGQVGASLFERITYDVDYVQKVNDFLDQGKDYSPKGWDTTKREGANKLKMYKAIYSKLKTRLGLTTETKNQKTTAYKTTMGQAVETYVNSLQGFDFTKDVFKVTCEYYENSQGTPPDSTVAQCVNASQFVEGDTGYIYIFVSTADLKSKDVTVHSFSKTNYDSGWTKPSLSNGTATVSFNVKSMASSPNLQGKTICGIKDTGIVKFYLQDSKGSTTTVEGVGSGKGSKTATYKATNVPAGYAIYKAEIVGLKLSVSDESKPNQTSEFGSFDTPTYVDPNHKS